MSRYAARICGVIALLFVLVPGSGSSAMAADTPDANSWFASLTPAQILPFVQNFPTWRSQGSTDPNALSFGAAAPTLAYSLPTFDLLTGHVTGSTQLTDALTPSGSYCARLLVNHVPVDIVVCADPTSDGTGYQISGANEVTFLSTGADLPSSGTTSPDHDFVGVVNGAVVPLDQTAQTWLGASSLVGTVFVTLVAEQKAEFDAIDKINGPAMGGGIPLIGGNRATVAAFEAAVAKGSGVPMSRLSHPWTVAQVQGAAHDSTHSTGWIVPVVAFIVLAAAALTVTFRRPRRVGTAPS